MEDVSRALVLASAALLAACGPATPAAPVPPPAGRTSGAAPTTRLVLDGPHRVGDLDCADFVDQAAAQERLRADRRDPDHLDADRDGIACEKLR